MSRSGYGDCDYLPLWRQAVARAITGKRGQDFMRELLAALDALPAKRLIASEFESDGDVCALGAIARARGLSLEVNDYDTGDDAAAALGIAPALAREILYENDEGRYLDTPEERYARMRRWVAVCVADGAK